MGGGPLGGETPSGFSHPDARVSAKPLPSQGVRLHVPGASDTVSLSKWGVYGQQRPLARVLSIMRHLCRGLQPTRRAFAPHTRRSDNTLTLLDRKLAAQREGPEPQT